MRQTHVFRIDWLFFLYTLVQHKNPPQIACMQLRADKKAYRNIFWRMISFEDWLQDVKDRMP